jgi:hypothetical protein
LSQALESHLAKYRKLVPAIALLTHVIDEGRGSVGVVALNKAIGWARYLESHARRIYGMLASGELSTVYQLGDALVGGVFEDGFTARDVYRTHRSGLSDPKAVAAGLQRLIDLGWLREKHKHTGGRPRVVYEINPDVERFRRETTARSDRSSRAGGGSLLIASPAPAEKVSMVPEPCSPPKTSPTQKPSGTQGTFWDVEAPPQSRDDELGFG